MTITHTLAATVVALAIACGPVAQPQPVATTSAAAASPAATATAGTQAATAAPAGTIVSTCRAPAAVTVASTEGPFYKANPPEKASLVTPGMTGTRVVLTGLVHSRSCAPIAGAKVDIWQSDASGNYDNIGYTLRGYAMTNAQGIYRIETIVPGEYPGRTPHIHVKVTPPGRATLTSQLYFAEFAARNASDGIFAAANVVTRTPGSPAIARFDFVVDVA